MPKRLHDYNKSRDYFVKILKYLWGSVYSLYVSRVQLYYDNVPQGLIKLFKK